MRAIRRLLLGRSARLRIPRLQEGDSQATQVPTDHVGVRGACPPPQGGASEEAPFTHLPPYQYLFSPSGEKRYWCMGHSSPRQSRELSCPGLLTLPAPEGGGFSGYAQPKGSR